MLKVLPPSSDEFHHPSMGKRTAFAPERMDRETVKTLPEGFLHIHTQPYTYMYLNELLYRQLKVNVGSVWDVRISRVLERWLRGLRALAALPED